ncbi:hypothetical protein Tco_0581550 [Tanacetum coccineum]
MVHQLTKFHVQRVDMVINPPWKLPFLGAKGLTSPEQTATEHVEFDESDTYVLERFDTSAGNPVKEILLKLNLPDHRSILTDSKVTVENRFAHLGYNNND